MTTLKFKANVLQKAEPKHSPLRKKLKPLEELLDDATSIDTAPLIGGAAIAANSAAAGAAGASNTALIISGSLLLGAAAVGLGGSGGGGGGDSTNVYANPTGTFSGNGNGINNAIMGTTSYSTSIVNAPIQIKDILNAYADDSNGRGYKWGNELGTGVTLTYSFSVQGTSTFAEDYKKSGFAGALYAQGVSSLTQTQKLLALLAMANVSSVANINFVSHSTGVANDLDANDTATHAGDIRWSNTNNMSGYSGLTYSPDWNIGGVNQAISGDIWLSTNRTYITNPVSNWEVGYAYFVLIHELEHALGLSHPHETSPDLLSEDAIKFTVESYRDFVGDLDTGWRTTHVYPQSLMLNDIAALQYLYGANTSYRNGDDVYHWENNEQIFKTIYDAGGNDTIDASNQSQAVIINLNPGEFSSIGSAFFDGNSYVRNCLALAYEVSVNNTVINYIENAIGSQNDDSLIGNATANTLSGKSGIDTLTGGAGADRFVFDTTLGASNIDYILDFNHSEGDKIVLDATIFANLAQELASEWFTATWNVATPQSAQQHILYDLNNGGLFYDADGSGDQTAECFAFIQNYAPLTAADFVIA